MYVRHNWSYLCGLYFYFIQINISSDAGILPLTQQKPILIPEQESSKQFAGFIEYQPNGTIVLRSDAWSNATNQESLALFQTILKTIKVKAPFDGAPTTKLNIRIYGEGIEHKFPPFLERVIQRIQTYFSVYRYTDTSRPVRPETLPATATVSNSYGDGASGGGGVEGNTQSENNYLTTTIIEIGNPGDGEIGNTALNYVNNFEQTTPLVDDNADGNTYGNINGNEDYPEFIEITSNERIIRKDQD